MQSTTRLTVETTWRVIGLIHDEIHNQQWGPCSRRAWHPPGTESSHFAAAIGTHKRLVLFYV